MKLVVTGTREGRPDVYYWLDRWVLKFGAPELVIVGDASGVDSQAFRWADDHDYAAHMCMVDPKLDSPIRYHLRNQQMVELASVGDWCVGFPGPASRGTWDCLRRAKKRGLFAYCPKLRAA